MDDYNGCIPPDYSLYHAVVDNNFNLLNDLLRNGADVDTLFYEDAHSSKSLLHVCCGKGFTDCLRVLIQHGVQLDIRDQWAQTALMHSVIIQFSEIVEMLLKANQELVNDHDIFGKAALHYAVEAGNLELVELLLNNGADVNVRNVDGFSPLMMCCKCTNDSHPSVMRKLLDSGALVDLEDYKTRQTSMHIAVNSKNVEAVRLLIAAGANTDAIDKIPRNPLTHAIFREISSDTSVIESIVTLLVSAGAKLNVTEVEICNPLIACSHARSAKLMKFFLASGADPNLNFPSGRTPALVSAGAIDGFMCLRVLIQYNSDLTRQGNVETRRRREKYFIDPFQMALMKRHLDVCVLLVLSGYPLCQKWHMNESKRCLMVAFPDLNADVDNNLVKQSVVINNTTDMNPPSVNCSKNDKIKWLSAMSRECGSLKSLSISVIRSCLKQNLREGVEQLPIPRIVKDAVMLKHILDLSYQKNNF